MPEFETYIDIDPSEYIDSCSKTELDELIDLLTEEGHITRNSKKSPENKNLMDLEWDEIIEKLSSNRLMLTQEEEDSIRKISKRF